MRTNTVVLAAASLAAVIAGGSVAAAKPAQKPVGARAAALVVPSGDPQLLRATLRRSVGFSGVYQPSNGTYCLVPKPGVDFADAVAAVTVERLNSSGAMNTAQWASDPIAVGCRAKQLAVITVGFDGAFIPRASNTVAFSVVVP
jgi:hypothetical protein